MPPKKGKKKSKAKAPSVRDRMEGASSDDKNASLKELAKTVSKALGKSGAVYTGDQHREFKRIPTSVAALNYCLGGGLVRGQVVQFTGAESSFKSTAAILCVRDVQELGGTALWLAGEGFDKKWASKWGVNLADLILITADTGDTALEGALTLVESGLVDLMVVDSIQSLGTTREINAGVDDENYAGAGAGQMWGRVMRRMYAAMNAGADTAIVTISQVRAPIGKYGMDEPQGSGIWALKHWKGADIYFRKGDLDYVGDATERRRILGREFKLRCLKNKTADAVERQASFWLRFKKGDDGGKRLPIIDNAGTLFRLGRAYGLIKNKGAWFKGYGINAQGEEGFVAELEDDKEAQAVLYEDLNDLSDD